MVERRSWLIQNKAFERDCLITELKSASEILGMWGCNEKEVGFVQIGGDCNGMKGKLLRGYIFVESKIAQQGKRYEAE